MDEVQSWRVCKQSRGSAAASIGAFMTELVCLSPGKARAKRVLAFVHPDAGMACFLLTAQERRSRWPSLGSRWHADRRSWGILRSVPFGTPPYRLEHLRIRAKCPDSLGFVVDALSSVPIGTPSVPFGTVAPQAGRWKRVSGLARVLQWIGA